MTKELTVSGGSSEEVQIDNLYPGEYTVIESATTNGTRLITGNSVKVTVVGNNASSIPTAAFTNNYAKAEVQFEGTKSFQYGKFPTGIDFEFEVYKKTDYDNMQSLNGTTTLGGVNATPVAKGSTGGLKPSEDGKIHFTTTPVTYTYADIGVHEYVIVEKIPETADENGYDKTNDIQYDLTVKNVKVTVSVDPVDPSKIKVEQDASSDSVEFINKKIYTDLELTKSLDKIVTGDTENELVDVTLVFKVTYKDPISNLAVNRTVSVKFDANNLTAQTVKVTKIPIEATNVAVTEVYSADYTGTLGEVSKDNNSDGTPVFSVTAENRKKGDVTGGGLINVIDPKADGARNQDGSYNYKLKNSTAPKAKLPN